MYLSRNPALAAAIVAAMLLAPCPGAPCNLATAGPPSTPRQDSDEQSIDRLIERLQSRSVEQRQKAARRLSKMGRRARAAGPQLLKALEDPDAKVRIEAALALFHVQGKAAIPALERALAQDPSPDVQFVIISIFRNAAPDNSQVIPRLVKMIDPSKPARIMVDPNSDEDGYRFGQVQSNIRSALARFGEAAAPELIKAAQDTRRDSSARCSAVKILGEIGPKAHKAVPGLIELLQDRDEYLRYNTICALGNIGPNARDALRPLMDAVKKERELWIRMKTAQTLYRIDPSNKMTLPLLKEALVHGSSGERANGADYAGALGHKAAPLVPVLIETLKDPSPVTRREAARALGNIGPPARSAIPSLRQLIQEVQDEEHDYVRAAARRALENIENKADSPRGP